VCSYTRGINAKPVGCCVTYFDENYGIAVRKFRTVCIQNWLFLLLDDPHTTAAAVALGTNKPRVIAINTYMRSIGL
jgi:hypothetical protein